jgi:hypothetical protein
MPLVKIASNASSGDFVQLTAIDAPGKNVILSQAAPHDWVINTETQTAASALAEFNANRVLFFPSTQITQINNVNPKYIWLRAQSSASTAYARWE